MGKLHHRVRAVCVVLCVTGTLQMFSVARADSLRVGDVIRFIDHNGSPGGEFGIARVSPDPTGELFRTFCIQTTEFIDFNLAGFRIGGITNHSVLGGQPLSPGAAFLYTKFRNGTLPAYGGTETDANKLQAAIWQLQGQNLGIANQYYNYARDAVDGSAPINSYPSSWGSSKNVWGNTIGNVRVLNLYWATSRSGFAAGTDAQDQLTIVPTPNAALAGVALLGLLVVKGRMIVLRSHHRE